MRIKNFAPAHDICFSFLGKEVVKIIMIMMPVMPQQLARQSLVVSYNLDK